MVSPPQANDANDANHDKRVLNSFDQNQRTFQSLKKIIQQDHTTLVPFIGAGLSRFGPVESRMPLWKELVELLVERADENGQLDNEEKNFINALIVKGNLIAAIDRLSNDIMGEKQFRIAIKEILDLDNKEIPPAIEELVCISWSLIVTTNLDKFVERAWQNKHSDAIEVFTQLDTHSFAEAVSSNFNRPVLLKSHGTIDVVESWVLNASDYIKLVQESPGYLDALKTLFKKKILFLGYGMSDDDFHKIAEDLSSVYASGVGEYYALLPNTLKGTPVIKSITKKYPLRPIWYDVIPGREHMPDGGHAQVRDCLNALVKAWIKGKQKLKAESICMPVGESLFVGRELESNQLTEAILHNKARLATVFGFGGEGKTTFASNWIRSNFETLQSNGFEAVFECSFYKADTSLFIDSAYRFLCNEKGPLSISGKLEAIKNAILSRKVLLLLDGLEALQNSEGKIVTSAVEQIIDVISRSDSVAIFTTRVMPSFPTHVIDLQHLSIDDACRILKAWGLRGMDNQFQDVVEAYIGTHALSVRIIAGFLDRTPSRCIEDAKTIGSLSSIENEGDTRYANKAQRVLESYWKTLSNNHKLFMFALSLLRSSARLSLIVDTVLNKGLEWESVEQALLRQRLLILEDDGTLTAHPLVKRFFQEKCPSEQACQIHSLYSDHFEQSVNTTHPHTLEQARPLVEACYHAAHAGRWDKFRRIFEHRLNDGERRHLGDSLGAWDDYLGLVALALESRAPNPLDTHKPSYYESAMAYGLKKTGKLDEAVDWHLEAALKALTHGDPNEEWGRQVNNCGTVSIALGRLSEALSFFHLNAVSLNDIHEREKLFWQREHFLYGMGKLAYRAGELSRGLEYFDLAARERASSNDRPFHYDYHVITHAELLVSVTNENVDRARAVAMDWLNRSTDEQWFDVSAVCCKTLCAIDRIAAMTGGKGSLDDAAQWLGRAADILLEKPQPEAQLEIDIEAVRLELATGTNRDWRRILDILDRAKSQARDMSGFVFYQDIDALTAVVLDRLGNTDACRSVCSTVHARARETGAFLVFDQSWDLFIETAHRHGIAPPITGRLSIPSPDEIQTLQIEPNHIIDQLRAMRTRQSTNW